jgi:foldase protein PrsA
MRRESFYIDTFMVVAVLALLAAGGCQWFGNSGRENIATVDGAGISLADFTERMEKKLSLMADAASLNEKQVVLLKADVLNELIDEKVMINRADKLGISVGDGELKKRIEEIKKDYPDEGFKEIFKGRESYYRTWKEELRKRLILEKLIHQEVTPQITVTDEEILSYIKSHAKEGISKERVRISQILLPDREKADAVLERLNNGEDFDKVAKEVSTDSEAEKEGDMGFFSRGVLPEALDRVVFSLSPGKISKVVETPYGYHIVKVLEKEKSAEVLSAKARDKVRAKLKREKEERAYSEWLGQLRSRAVVKINESVLSKTGGRKNQPAQK